MWYLLKIENCNNAYHFRYLHMSYYDSSHYVNRN